MNSELEAIITLLGLGATGLVAGFGFLTVMFGIAQYTVDKETAQEMMHHYEAGRLPKKPTAWNIREMLYSDMDRYRELLLIDAREYNKNNP